MDWSALDWKRPAAFGQFRNSRGTSSGAGQRSFARAGIDSLPTITYSAKPPFAPLDQNRFGSPACFSTPLAVCWDKILWSTGKVVPLRGECQMS